MNRPKTGARRLTIDGRCVAVVIGMSALAGCVQIDTPDKPIEINLNINIRQEVVYRLDGDAKKLIEQNSEIF
ncbi:YnbE family lipoprotein [Sphingopyxis sp.]|uniref:YnbE family lipoprotein n=1 Tax=Sphingopyxis sp. TaxID=1908224 RepID=UPI002B4915AF|nr:YnbE family lipoprotein [Sphingopyxis sp.]